MTTDLSAVLIAHGVRPTKQRLAVYAYLLAHRTHPNADTIYRALVAEHPHLSLTTVYNSLHALANAGLIREFSPSAEEQRFDGDMEHHTHFCCTQCGDVLDFPLSARTVGLLRPKNCRVDRIEVLLHGVCAQCLAKTKSKK